MYIYIVGDRVYRRGIGWSFIDLNRGFFDAGSGFDWGFFWGF